MNGGTKGIGRRSGRYAALALLTVSTTAAVTAQHAPQPRGGSDAVTLPPGAGATTLPKGHPDIPGMGKPMPSGHPEIAGAATGPAAAPAAGTQGAGMHLGGSVVKRQTTGGLRVVTTQSTRGGTSTAKDPVTVQLFSNGKVTKTYVSALDEKGVLQLDGLPLDPPFQPVITVKHGGAEQQMVGPPVHIYQPAVEVTMKVYETTAEKPAWTVGMRHVRMSAVKTPAGTMLKVVETLGGHNPLERAWIGEGDPKNPEAPRQTFAIALSAGATDIVMGPGIIEARSRFENGVLIRGGTMLPGSSEYVFGYSVPVAGGKASLTLHSPADTTLLAVYVPSGMKVDKALGLEVTKTSGGAHVAAERTLYKAKNVKAGAAVSLELSGIKTPEQEFVQKPWSVDSVKPEGHP